VKTIRGLLPHPLPPLLEKERGRRKRRGASPLLDSLFLKIGGVGWI
jgi:hypothetical protein